MSSPNSMYKRYGAIELPLDGAAAQLAGIFPDPARDALLALFATAINDELAEGWGQIADGTPMAGRNPVQDQLPMEPNQRTVQERHCRFPLLALHRSGSAEYTEHTLVLERRTQQWELHYLLEALTLDHLHRFTGALVYVPTVVANVIRHRGHPSYEAGASQFGTGKGGISSIRMVKHESGMARFANDDTSPAYAACTMTFETTELEGWVDGSFADLQGARFDFAVGGSDGTIASLIYADTDHPG